MSRRDSMIACTTLNCPNPADDEYHWYEDISPYGQKVTVEVVWPLCEKCCAFACDVVELIANLETEVGEWLK